MLMVLLKKTDYATEITKIKNDYVTNAALTSRLNDLRQKSHFESEIKKEMIKLIKTVQIFYLMKVGLNKKKIHYMM